jgi:hypothetical protein
MALMNATRNSGVRILRKTEPSKGFEW